MVIDFENETEYAIRDELLKRLEEILSSEATEGLELIVVDDVRMQEINDEQRGKKSTTDVLSFPIEGMPILGTIIISMDRVCDEAKQLGHSEEEEFILLFIHGMLHLLGYDHECDSGEMRAEEARLIQKHHLPQSLIIRSE